MKSDQAAGVALILIAGFVAFEARRLPFGSLTSPGPGYWPMILAAALALFGLAAVVLGCSSPRLADRGWTGIGKALAILGSCVFIALALEPLGYRLTIALAVVFLLGVIERKHALIVLGAALILSFGTHYLIDHLLNVPLPRGFWEL